MVGSSRGATPRPPASKIHDADGAVRWRAAQSGRVVFTNGVFDLLHPGHVDVLFAARLLGDALVVALNSDASVQRLKGPTRPVRSESERATVLAALECVDAVVGFGSDTPLEIIAALGPDVLVKGGDYSPETIVGASFVRARGGEVVVIPLTPGHSTTRTVNQLRGDSQGSRSPG